MALVPPGYLNAVVALGHQLHDLPVRFIATGFLYGYPREIDPSDGQRWYTTFLVTNRHVVEGVDSLLARFDRQADGETQVVPLPLEHPDGSKLWTTHPGGADIAIVPISVNTLRDENIRFEVFQGDNNAISKQQAAEQGIGEASGVFVLGFPLGLAGEERNYAIVRQGIIARAQDWLNGTSDHFLIDSSVFPGNSGGPVLTKPETVSIKNTQSFMRCVLIGMVSSYIPYLEEGVSNQTGQVRMRFEENSGLAVVIPVDQIDETIVHRLTYDSSEQ
ncbi:MAG: serine protease [Truepera sp.]|nr:serine protease [Truepera sp.]